MTEARAKSRADEAALWWVDLAKGLADMSTGVATRDPGRRMAAREALWEACGRWGRIVGHPLGAALMADHVALISALADAASRREGSAMSAFVSAALLNAEDQGRLYGADAPRFPQDAWRDAMAVHIARTAAYLEALITGDISLFTLAFKRAMDARDALAVFWMRILLPTGGRSDESGSTSAGSAEAEKAS